MVHRVEMSELPPVRHDDFQISLLSVNQLLKELHSQLNLTGVGYDRPA